ncbi:MAG: PilZ domain-containing protein [Gammaproteobacteria bacterium]|nr:PilZ domain-containing protein [Gammaproteobacteria bacterium]
MIDYSEKRDFIRMAMHCPVAIRPIGSANDETAELRDLSASGVRFVSARELSAGEHLQLTLRPANPITPPLQAAVTVLRCFAIDDGFDIAASIVEIEPVEYSAAD